VLIVKIKAGEVGFVPNAIVLGFLGDAAIGVVLVVIDSGLGGSFVTIVPPAAGFKNVDRGVAEEAGLMHPSLHAKVFCPVGLNLANVNL